MAVPKYSFLHTMKFDDRVIDLDPQAVRSITQTLDHVVSGSDVVLRSPFMAGHDVSYIITKFESVFDADISGLNPDLAELEMSSKSKIAPRSQSKPWIDRRDDVSNYFGKYQGEADPSDLFKFESKGTLRPISLQEASKFLLNNTAAGLPFMGKKGAVKDQALAQFSELNRRVWPAMLYTRTQEAKKTRTVWGIPITMVLNEMRYYRPLLSLASRVTYRAALRGPDEVNLGITRLIDHSKSSGWPLLSIDFSSYDQSIKRPLQETAFAFIASRFQKSMEYQAELSEIAKRFATVPLITPDGVMGCPDPLNPNLDGSGLYEHGVPSGSTFTNEVDSIVQYLMAFKHGANPLLTQVQGDDGAYCVEKPDALKAAFMSYGLNVNLSKSYTNNKFLVYLQNFFCDEYRKDGVVVGIYPIYRALGRLIYLENWTDFDKLGINGDDYFSIRAISILENCKHHPLFEKFVQFVFSNDREGLKFSDKGLAMYVKNTLSKGSQEVKNQYGEYVQGIKSFETFKILRRLL